MSTEKRWIVIAAVVAMSLAVGAEAQQPAPPGGTVSGHVVCGDTQRPARFATVLLFGVPTSVTPAVQAPNGSTEEQMAAAIANLGKMDSSFVQTQTDENGAFSATGVAPGDYYVFASVPGYVQPVNQVKAALEAGADPKKPLTGVPIVHVSAARESLADVSIDRGAAVSGKVVWEDGSPVTKATVTVVPSKGDKPLPPAYAMVAMGSIGAGGVAAITDDLGHFRIAGLASGDYFVKVALQTTSQFSMQKGKMNFNFNQLAAAKPLTIFAPSAFHQSTAKAVTLTAGQSVDGEDVTVNLMNLHSVSGRIASAEDHHLINSGMILLMDGNDKEFARSASVNEDGTFTVRFVPSGTYTLQVEDAADTVPSTKKPSKGLLNFSSDETVKSYEEAKQSVIVTDDDVPGQNIDLTPSATVKKQTDLGAILGTLTDTPPAASAPQKQ